MATNHEFRTEVRKMLKIITHSLYTNREIFLRELISNASDALDKLRFQLNRGATPVAPDLPLEISITLNKDAKTLTISDTGIGMTQDELVNNLGTIAKSGSEEFLANLEGDGATGAATGEGEAQTDAAQIIGRFGVGFYAVFMVADKVEVTSRPALVNDAPAFTWASDGLGTFTVEESTNAPARGTVIVAHLKDDAAEFLEKYRIESIIRKHSAFIGFPVLVDGERTNTTPALWREPKFSITKEQYADFYKFISYDSTAPLDTLHFSVDVPVQFNALLFLPDTPFDFFGTGRDHWGLDLYGRRVLIMRENKDLLPEYLGFLKGVVDTEDLPLNISRETLQENVVLRKIQQTITKQTLGHLEKIAGNNEELYNKFWRLHGKIFKLGYHDFINRERIGALLRFNSSIHDDAEALTSLDAYISRAEARQSDTPKTIWYVSAPSREAARLNPHLERFVRKGVEVLYLYEPIDEFAMEGMGAYKEWKFEAVENAADDALDKLPDVNAGDAPKAQPLSDDDVSAFERFIGHMKEALGDRVKDVRVSHRLADSPACLVSPDGSMTSSMEKMLRIMQKDDSIPQKVLEVNRDHPLLRSMLRIYKSNADDATLKEMILGLFDTSLLLDGYLRDPHALAARTNRLMEQASAWYTEIQKM